MKIAVLGYYGFGNLGDDLLLEVLLQKLSERFAQAHVQILGKTARKSIGECARGLWKTDLFILGGGSLLQDRTSFASLVFYLALTLAAKVLGAQVWVLGVGVGPFKRKISERLTAWVLSFADQISVRDSASKRWLELKLPSRSARQTADWALLKEMAPVQPASGSLLWIVRREIDSPQALAEKIRRVHQLIAVPGVVVALEPQKENLFLRKLESLLPQMQFPSWKNQHDLINVLRSSEMIVSFRLHGVILSALMNAAVVAVEYDPKITAFVDDLAAFGAKINVLQWRAWKTNGGENEILQAYLDRNGGRRNLMSAISSLKKKVRVLP